MIVPRSSANVRSFDRMVSILRALQVVEAIVMQVARGLLYARKVEGFVGDCEVQSPGPRQKPLQ